MKLLKEFFYPILFLIVTFSFFQSFFLQSKLPIPADTIIGLYHPFRDLYANDYPNGIPYKNFLITDPVRQQYPWRELSIFLDKKLELPLWNPYNFSGTPLLANFQSGAFYPFNVLFFILPFSVSWSILVILQPILAGLFLYFYLRYMSLSQTASFLGGLIFAFSGFSIGWLEWGNVIQTGLWLPLILLSIDKIFYWFSEEKSKIKNQKSKIKIKIKNYFIWPFIFVSSVISSFLAGHLQIFFYVFIITMLYFVARWIQFGLSKNILLLFLLLTSCFLLLTSVQWFPTLQLINLSARDVDQMNWQQIEGWFIPWQHLVQFVAPDFFGNPTTLNYWGVWNYGEFIGYIGIAPLILSLFAILFRRDKKTLFFSLIFLLSLIFSLPTIFAKLPYILNIPFLSTSQPTRLLFLTDFSLAILAALGIDIFMRSKRKNHIFLPIFLVVLILAGLWLFVFQNFGENISIAKRNLYLPTILLLAVSLLFLINTFIKQKGLNIIFLGVLIIIIIFDLIRFGHKFTPFTNPEYLFPSTKIISFLQKDKEQFRIMTTDSRILPPNFSTIYRLQSVDGYDPLYLRRYGELIAASERGKPDIHTPFGFNRIITPHNVESQIMNLLGVKYVLTFSDLSFPKFTKILEEGQTKVYQNNDAFPRAFFVEKIKLVNNKQEAIEALFDKNIDLRTTAIVENPALILSNLSVGEVEIVEYSENKIIINTKNRTNGFLVLTDTFYPTWDTAICSKDVCSPYLATHRTDYNFRGIFVPAGEHSIIFYNTLL